MHTFRIPGGATIRADAAEEHGRILGTLGVIDLPVTEALWRLVEPGDVCADVGANIGYMTGVLGARVKTGAVHSFEALPSIFEELSTNVASFRRQFLAVTFMLHGVAVSDRTGNVRMELPHGFGENRGIARVGEHGSVEVPAITLDDFFGSEGRVGVMKLDVEGHELSVLRGAEKMFREKRVRDVVFEEHRPYPSEVTRWLEERGYVIRRLLRRLRGPRLVEPSATFPSVHWLPQNFLATADPSRASDRCASGGWRALVDRS